MTPIEKALNIGPVTAQELISLGYSSLEKLQEAGLEEAYERMVERYPERLNLNCLVALYAAIEGISWLSVDANTKQRLKLYNDKLKKLLR